MKRLILTTITSVLITFGAPSTALAAGGTYFPPVKTPAKATTNTAKQAITPTPPCTGVTAPAMDVYSPSENDVTENPDGVWTLHLYTPQQNYAGWVVDWTTTPGITYDFEVSDSSATDPDTGKFVSPIDAYHVNGNVGTSGEIPISNGQTYYFHLNATGANGCPGKYVSGQITAEYDEVVPLGTTNTSHIGPQGTKLFGLALVAGLLFVAARRFTDLRYGRGTIQND